MKYFGATILFMLGVYLGVVISPLTAGLLSVPYVYDIDKVEETNTDHLYWVLTAHKLYPELKPLHDRILKDGFISVREGRMMSDALGVVQNELRTFRHREDIRRKIILAQFTDKYGEK